MLAADRARARTLWPARSAALAVSSPIPRLAPMMRILAMGLYLPSFVVHGFGAVPTNGSRDASAKPTIPLYALTSLSGLSGWSFSLRYCCWDPLLTFAQGRAHGVSLLVLGHIHWIESVTI